MDNQVNIEYVRPKFGRRVMANVIDAFIFIVLTVLLFLGAQGIAKTTDTYKNAKNHIDEVHLSSGLYAENTDGQIIDIVTYSDNQSYVPSRHREVLVNAIDTFLEYLETEVSVESYNKVQENYDEYRLEDVMVDGVHAFIRNDDGVIVENPDSLLTYKEYVEQVYGPYIDERLQAYLLSEVPGLLDDTRLISQRLLFIEIPIAFVLAGIITYLVPTFIFKRGRKTLGKLLYNVGAVNSKCLNLSIGKNIARFSIFFFVIVTLSFATFGVPLIINFSMMAFSKKRQGFADYMLGIDEIDTNSGKIYYSYDEIELEMAHKTEPVVDFKMEERL